MQDSPAMIKVAVNIPDQEIDFFLKLVGKLGLGIVPREEREIPESHQKIVLERINNPTPEKSLPAEEALALLWKGRNSSDRESY